MSLRKSVRESEIIKDGQMIFEDKKIVVEQIIGTDHQDLESLFLHLTK